MDSLQIRGGSKSTMPTLQDREFGYCKDEKALYIGADGANVKLCDADDPARITALETQTSTLSDSLSDLQTALGEKLTAAPAASQQALASDAALADVVTAYNALLAALKAAGIMSP